MPESNNTVKLKGTPILLDRAIQGLQQTLLTNLSWLDKAYGRGYKMVQHLDNGSKYVYPAAYVGGSEYVSLTPNDNIGNFCWFDIYDPQTVASQVPAFPTHTYRGALVFWLNLQAIYESDEFINSEEVKSEILSVITTPGAISSGVGRLTVTEVVEGLDSLYKGYTLERIYSMRNYAEEDLQALDKQFFMFPYYGVRFEFEIVIRETCPTKKDLILPPIIKEATFTENGEYMVKADKPGVLLSGVKVGVEVPIPVVEEVTETKVTENGKINIRPSSGFDAMKGVDVDVDIYIKPDPKLQEKSLEIVKNGTIDVVADEGFDGLGKVALDVNVVPIPKTIPFALGEEEAFFNAKVERYAEVPFADSVSIEDFENTQSFIFDIEGKSVVFVKMSERTFIGGVDDIFYMCNVNESGYLISKYKDKSLKIPIGVHIYTIEDDFVKIEDWDTANNYKAIGVSFNDGSVDFIVSKIGAGASKPGGVGVKLEGVTIAPNKETALMDFNGEENTINTISQLQGYTDKYGIVGAPSCEVCAKQTLPNGKKGYLPALGELQILYNNRTSIIEALTKINGATTAFQYYVNSSTRVGGDYTSYDRYGLHMSNGGLTTGANTAYHNICFFKL